MAGWVFLRPLSLAAGGCLLAVSSDGPSSVRDLWGAPGVPLRVPVSSAYKDAGASQLALVVKNPSANAGDVGDAGSIPGSGRSPGEGHGNPLQYSCLENHMVREGPAGIRSLRLQRIRHNQSDLARTLAQRKYQSQDLRLGLSNPQLNCQKRLYPMNLA